VKTIKFYLLLAAILTYSLTFSQIGVGPLIETHVRLSKLNVLDSCFLSSVDSLVLNSECPNLKLDSNRYFFVQFNNDSKCKDLLYVKFELHNIPLASESTLGYFILNSFTFFIDGIPPNYLFRKTETNKNFTIKKGRFIITEDYPLWHFSYENNSLKLIEMDCWE
jgi:hypothetical protein